MIVTNASHMTELIENAPDYVSANTSTLRIYVPPQSVLSFSDKIMVNNKRVHIFSDGEGAVMDAQHLSKVFKVQDGASMILEHLHFKRCNGGVGGYQVGDGGCILAIASRDCAGDHCQRTMVRAQPTMYCFRGRFPLRCARFFSCLASGVARAQL